MQSLKLKLNNFLANKFTHDGAGWLFLQQLIIAPMSLFTTVILARILSLDDYGFYKYILSMYGTISLFSLGGFMSIAGLNIQRGQDHFFHIGFNYRKILRWIPSVISLFIAIYYFYNQNNFLGTLFLITIFSHFFVETYSFYSTGFFGKGAFKLSSIFEIVNYFISYFPPIVVAYLFRNDVNVIIMVFLTMFFCQFVFRYFAFHYVVRKFNFNKNKIADIVESLDGGQHQDFKKESLALSFNSAISGVGSNLSGVIVFNRLGAADNAIYALAVTFSDFAMTIVASTLNRSIFVLSSMTKENLDKNKIDYIKSLYKKYFLYAFLLMIFTMSSLPFVYKYMFPKYFFSYHYAVIYALSILSIAFYPAFQYFLEKRDFKSLNIIQIAILILNAVSLFLATQYFGIWGAITTAIIMKFINNGVYAAIMYYKK